MDRPWAPPLLSLLLLPLLLLPAGCGDPAPSPGEGGGTEGAGAPPAHAVFVEAPPSPPAAPRKPLPVRPADEAERLRGLVGMLEWGDIPLVEFAQERIASFPDREAAAGAIEEKGLASLRPNPALVHNLLGCVKDGEFGRLLLPFLLRCLDCEDPQVRRMAVLQYAQSAEEPDLALLAGLVADPWYPVSQAALEGLRHHPGPAAAEALRGVIPGTAAFVRAAALSTLGHLGEPASVPLLRGEMEAAEKEGPDAFPVYLGAAQGLARLGDEGGLEALRGFVLALPLERPAVPLDSPREQWDGPEVILADAGDALMRGRLVRQAKEADRGAAAAALRLLQGYPASPETVGAFLAGVEREEWETILEGLDGLRSAGSPDFLQRTLAGLSAPGTDRRYASALALGRFREPSTVKPLVERLAVERDPSVARKICDAMGILGDPAAAPALVAFMRGETAPSPERALIAFEARQNLRGAVAAAAAGELAALVEDRATPAAIRFHAARALGQAPAGEGPRRALAGLLSEGNPDFRAAAADALADLGDRGARDALAQAYAREPDEVVASALLDAILRLDLGAPVAPR